MKLVRDTTGRFRERPHYELDELEEECERTAFTFLEEQYGQVLVPIPTNALVVLIEQYAEDLDLFADLSGEGANVQGVTEFFTSGKPQVRIARELSKQFWRAHRLRTTLAHEYGHYADFRIMPRFLMVRLRIDRTNCSLRATAYPRP
jgi:hypothetical protein